MYQIFLWNCSKIGRSQLILEMHCQNQCMLPLVFPKFSVLFFSASTPPLLPLLLPLSLFLSSNLQMTHNFTFLFPHPISSVKSIILKIFSLPCCHNSLSLNPDKSDYVRFETRQRSHSFSDVTMVNVADSLVHLLLARNLIHQLLDTCHLAPSALRILAFSPFLGQRQSSVCAHSVLLRRPFLILSFRTSDQPTTSLCFAAF